MGMLVDNALVICDGIKVRMRRGVSAMRAARETLGAIQISLLAATLIGILAFAGVGLSQDQTGEFLFSLFAVVGISLSLSWILAITIVPMLAYYWLAGPQERDEKEEAGGAREKEAASAPGGNREDPAFQGRLYGLFRGLLRVSLRFSVVVVASAVGLTVACVLAFGLVRQAFFPPAALPIGFVDINARSGADIRVTDERVGEIEAWIVEEFPQIDNVLRLLGQGATRFMLTYSPQQPDPGYAQLMMLVDDPETLDPILARINRELPDLHPDLDINGLRLVFGANPEARVEARFHGEDPAVLRELSRRAQALIREEGTLENVRDDWREREIVLRPQLDLERMAETGVSREDVGQALMAVTDGVPLGVLVEGERQRTILLRAPAEDRPSAQSLLDTMVFSSGSMAHVPMRQIAGGIEVAQVESVIHRRDRERVISIRAEPPVGMEANDGRERVAERLEALELPPGYRMSWGGVYETSSDAEGALIGTIVVPYLAMFALTILLFAAFSQAIVVWLVVPMSIIGIVLGHLLTGQPFSFVSLFGLLSLTGLLLKNAIVLVEEIDIRIRNGEERRVAIVEGTTSRVLPILLLAITTILGMVPLLTDPLFASMAVTMMGGLGVSALLTLLVTPCLYDLIVPWSRGHKARDTEGSRV